MMSWLCVLALVKIDIRSLLISWINCTLVFVDFIVISLGGSDAERDRLCERKKVPSRSILVSDFILKSKYLSKIK